MLDKKNHKRVLIIIMGALFIIGFGIANLVYLNKNKGVDPRVIPARKLYNKYNAYAQENNFSAIFSLLDSIEFIYKEIPHYKESYEIGVLYNNRAASFLTMAIHFADSSLSLDGVNVLSKDSLLALGKLNAEQSAGIYEQWLKKYGELSLTEISDIIQDDFLQGLRSVSAKKQERFLNSRKKEIEIAQYETKRRLSVAYTNLGIVERHNENYEQAVVLYKQALDFWNQNLTAENNMNVLLGRPLKKQKIIEKFFPPDKEKN